MQNKLVHSPTDGPTADFTAGIWIIQMKSCVWAWQVLLLCIACLASSTNAMVLIPEVVVTPRSSVKALAKTLSSMPVGTRQVYLDKFAEDIAQYDMFIVRTVGPGNSKKVVSQRFQSPWLDKGIMIVNARVSGFMSKLSKAQAPIDGFQVAMPASISGTRLADTSLLGLSSILRDPRAAALGQLVGIPSLAALATDPSAINKWREASPSRANAMLALAVDSAVKKWYPNAIAPSRSILPPAAEVPVVPVAPNPNPTPPAPPVTPPAPPVTPPAPPVTPPTVTPSVASPNTQINATINSNVDAVFAQSLTPRLTSNWEGGLEYKAGSDWSAVFIAAQTSPELRQLLLGMDNNASIVGKSYMYVRPNSLADINPTIVNPRVESMTTNRETYALAIVDCTQSDFVRSQGVALATLAAYTNNAEYTAKCIEILEAMIAHSPLQRPGWTLSQPGATMPEGGDGIWLATSWGMCGIVDMLSILGDRVPAATRESLHDLLRTEVGRITADWASRRPWFVKSQAVASNQWIEPNIGLVKTCLYLKDPALLGAYNMGVENLARSIENLGADGAFLEGFSYCSQTSGGLFEVIGNLKSNGDMRCHAFPYVNNAWKWMLHMYLPGRRLVNSYDSGMSNLPSWAISSPMNCLAAAAIGSSDPDAIPTLKSLFNSGLPLLAGIRYKAAINDVGSSGAIPTFAYFPSQQQVVWRSEWQAPVATRQTALAIWLKGGSLRDGHSQRDQGQVSIYCGNRIVLMDCGTPEYSTPRFEQDYAQAAGHGIMQIGEQMPRSKPVNAPVSVATLDQGGGDVTIDTTAAYNGVSSCTRRVRWSSNGLFTIDDHVELTQGAVPGTEFYRFHTGSTAPLVISGSGSSWHVEWAGTSATITASRAISVEQVDWADATTAPFRHRALIIHAVDSGSLLDLSTQIQVDRSITE